MTEVFDQDINKLLAAIIGQAIRDYCLDNNRILKKESEQWLLTTGNAFLCAFDIEVEFTPELLQQIKARAKTEQEQNLRSRQAEECNEKAREMGYLSVKEAAKYLSVSDAMIRYLVRQKTIRSVKFDGRYFLDPAELDRYRAAKPRYARTSSNRAPVEQASLAASGPAGQLSLFLEAAFS